MANIVKLQDDLKGIPLKNLIMYVQNPNGQVPSYLALAEIKRRKDMEQRAAAEQNAPAHLSVAEELTAPRQNIGPQFDIPQSMMAAQKQGLPSIPPQQMAQGGIADLDPGNMYDDKHYAGGGIVAFAEGGEVKHFQEGGPSVASLKYQAALADSYLDPRYLVAGAKDLVSRDIFGYRLVRDPVTGELIHARDLPSSVSELKTKKKSEVEALLDKAEKVKEERKSETAKRENVADLDPTLAAATFDKSQLFKDPNMSELYAIAQPKVKPLPEKSKIQEGATQEFNPYANVEKPASKAPVDIAGDTARRFQEMMGPDTEREELMKKIQSLETGAKEQERMAPWLALTKAGFGIAAGKSPFALQNIGEGAQSGIAEYVAARDRLDKLNERQLDIRAKLNQVARAEKTAGVSAGFTKELKQLEEDNANARNAATNLVHLKTTAMTAAKKSDYETFLDLARQDEDNYKTVKDKDGNVRKVFDANKATQVYRSFSGSSGLDDDKLFEAWKQEKLLNKNFNLTFQEYRNQVRGAAGASAAPSALPSGVKVTRTQ